MVRLHSNLWASGEGDFIPMTQWDACQEALPPLEPGDRTPAVLAVDAATSYDCFGVVLLTRHPERPADVAIRHTRIWKPPKGGKINYSGPEGFIRTLCQGGCRLGHPQREPWMDKAGCPACAAGDLIPPYNIIEVTYDPYQLVSIMQQLYREGVNAQPFSQGTDRLIADSQLYDLIMNLRIAHTGQADLREHIQNAAAKQSKEEDTKLRIVKKEAGRKIDLAVAVSMGSKRILYFQL
jgi:phage terminase large subunit-like protein